MFIILIECQQPLDTLVIVISKRKNGRVFCPSSRAVDSSAATCRCSGRRSVRYDNSRDLDRQCARSKSARRRQSSLRRPLQSDDVEQAEDGQCYRSQRIRRRPQTRHRI